MNISLQCNLFFRTKHFYHKSHFRKKSYTSLDYCINMVRNYDNENYLCTLLLPSSIRTTAMAIRAFNVEIASVKDQVSQAQLGVMRLKFWEDVVEKVYGGKVPNNPVAVELSKAVKRHKLSKEHLHTLVECRSRQLDQPTFPSVRLMEKYAGDSCGSVFQLLLEAVDIHEEAAKKAAWDLGVAQGLSNLLRGVPHCISQRQLSLPSDLLASTGLSEEDIFRKDCSEELSQVIQKIAFLASGRLQDAKNAKDEIPVRGRKIFLPAVCTNNYLTNLRRSNCDVFDSSLHVKPPFLQVKLYFNSLLNSY